MIGAIQNFISNPTLVHMSQSTVGQITTETCLKAVGRPSFILMDKDIDAQTKKFSATKEFLYQMVCLGIYLAAVMPVLKKGAFGLAKKIYPDEAVFKAFNTASEFLKYNKLESAAEKEAKLAEINSKRSADDMFVKENLNEDLAKGIVEVTSIVGSVTGLALLAPIVSHPLIHPIMKFIGVDKKDNTNDKTKTPAAQPQTK